MSCPLLPHNIAQNMRSNFQVSEKGVCELWRDGVRQAERKRRCVVTEIEANFSRAHDTGLDSNCTTLSSSGVVE